ncbi:hypothetical protein OSB04_001524 [Centaurea solstitialis]|uniref:FRIGIDA-like protein n=1 Tax=Centaurea solstitialis TaxID=347529 RepID=A0AA38TR49_9ASTR|nr:hypothetical protein OSB04_001524 [Centaurea solstitialis]
MTKDYVINPDRFKNFFNELDTRRTLLTTVTDLNTKLFNHFASLEQSLNQKSLTLDSQIQKFNQDTEKSLESLRIRESLIPDKESALAARVQELKDFGIADIEKGSGSDGKYETMPDLLKMWFRRMDWKGLMEYMLANRKKLVELRVETAVAAGEAVDLLGFVLEAVEEFVELKVSGKQIVGLAPTRCACGILVQAAFPIPSGGEPFSLTAAVGGVSRRLKERAAVVLDKWKGVLNRGGGDANDGVSSGEANMFVTMVIGFGLKERYDGGFLMGLVLEVGSKRDMAKLAVALGSAQKMEGVIEELVKTGKEIDAVYIASEAGLTDQFPPAKLLKSCLTNCQKIATNKDAPSMEDIINELTTVKTIMKLIEDHKLESEFNISNVKRQIGRLERARSDKKKGIITPSAKPSSTKRPRPPRRFGGTISSSSSRPPKSSRGSSGFRPRSRPPPTHHSSAARYPTASYNPTNPYGASYSQPPAAGYLQYANYPTQATGYGGQMNYGPYDYNAAPSEPTYNV